MIEDVEQELNETARLILMEEPSITFRSFGLKLRTEMGGVGLREMGEMWTRYRGWDGRTGPTHNVETGERIAR